MTGPAWVVVAEAREIGGVMRWVQHEGSPVTIREARGWPTAQRRNSVSGHMELLAWWSPAAAEAGGHPPKSPRSWRRAEVMTLAEAWPRGGLDTAYASLPGRTRRAIEYKARALGLTGAA